MADNRYFVEWQPTILRPTGKARRDPTPMYTPNPETIVDEHKTYNLSVEVVFTEDSSMCSHNVDIRDFLVGLDFHESFNRLLARMDLDDMVAVAYLAIEHYTGLPDWLVARYTNYVGQHGLLRYEFGHPLESTLCFFMRLFNEAEADDLDAVFDAWCVFSDGSDFHVEFQSGRTPFESVDCAKKALVVNTRTERINRQIASISSEGRVPRSVREEQQRIARLKRDKDLHKQIPKARRESDIRSSRKLKYEYLNGEFQNGRILGTAVVTSLAAVTYSIVKLCKRGDKVGQAVQSMIEQVKAAASVLKQAIGKVLWYVPLIMTVFYAVSKFKSIVPLAMSLLSGILISVVGPKVWSAVSNFFPGGDVQYQSGLVSSAPKLMATLFAFSVFGRKISPYTTTEFCKRISMLDKMSAGWETFCNWMLTAIETLVNFCRARFGKERIELFKRSHSAVKDWAREVDAITLSESTAGEVDGTKLDKMVELVRTGYGFKELYRGTALSKFIDDYVIKASNALQPYLGSLNARNNFRFEPAACMLRGPPGIGKTLMAMPFCAAVMLKSGLLPLNSTFEDVAKNVWQKGTSEYWNSYSNQICLVMDDAFQMRADATDKENEYMTLIRMVGTWSFPLNFADLASKGKVFFGSKFIFGTTNLRSFDSEAKIVLQEPQAVARRINFPYELRVKPEFAKDNKLDYDLFERELVRSKENNKGFDAFPWYIWEVRKHDFIDGSDSGEYFPLRDLINEISLDLRKRNENHHVTKTFLCDFVSGFAEEQAGRKLNDDSMYSAFCDVLNNTHRMFIAETSVWEKAKNLLLFGTAAFVGYTVIKTILSVLWKALSGVFRRGGDPRIQSNRPLTKPRKVKDNDIRLQSVDSSVVSNVYNNTYKMVLKLDNGSDFVVGQVCFICSEIAVQPAHFTQTVKDMIMDTEINSDTNIVFRSAVNNEHSITLKVSEYLRFSRHTITKSDVEFLKFESVRAHRNITRSFLKETDLKYVTGSKGRLDLCEIDDRKKLIAETRRNVMTLPSIAYGEDLAIGRKRLNRFFSYSAPTSQGDCGAPLALLDNSAYSGRTIIGLHVAGITNRSVGYSSVITQEMIDKAIAIFDAVRDYFEQDLGDRGITFQSGHVLPFEEKGSFLPICVVDRPVNLCPKTSYYPTELYGSFGDYSHLPAPMSSVWREGVLVHPMENAVKPYSTRLLHFDYTWMKTAMHVAMTPLTALTKDNSRRIYSFEESVMGVPQEKFRSIPRGTAAGYPYCLEVRNGKKEFFGEGEVYDLSNPKAIELRERVEYVISNAKNNIRLSHVFVDFLKDELRPPHKVEAVATRLISSAPLDYTIAWRMYFGAFSSAVMRKHTVSGMAPGICAYTEWDILCRQMLKKGPECFDGDFKAFDSSEQPSVHQLILDYINSWYSDGPENARVRKVLWLDLVHSRHIGGTGKDQRHIYQWNKSLPSGHPFTTIVNSMYSLFMLVSAYIHLTKDLTGFWSNVSAVTYGDDNIINVSSAVASSFNQTTVARALDDLFSVKYTAGDKLGELQTTFPIEKLTFLKRGFRLTDEGWLCPLELDSFLFTCYWCKNIKLEERIMLDVLELALEELSMHDARTWEIYGPKVLNALTERNHVTRVPFEQTQYLQLVRSREDSWY